jgi:aryl-alcohol dehydrogenase-like predicted oxidoreductase
MSDSCALVLGTAQLGFPYGVANKTGKPDSAMAISIISEAWENGIREFDTAQGYGDSELILGEALAELGLSQEAKIISKFDPSLDHLDASVLSKALNQSFQRLRVQSLYGMMLHREEMLSLWNKGLMEIMYDFVLSGRIKHVGISVYSPDKAIQALNTDGIDIVQLPTNILDRRFENASVFELAEKRQKRIYIRSVFLQGLILMPVQDIPERMSFARPVLERLEFISKRFGLTRQEVAIGYIKAKAPGAKIIFGTENPEQVREDVELWKKPIPQSLNDILRDMPSDISEKILNPTLWNN